MRKIRYAGAAALVVTLVGAVMTSATTDDAETLRLAQAVKLEQQAAKLQPAKLQLTAEEPAPVKGSFVCSTQGYVNQLQAWMNAHCDPDRHFALGGNTAGNDYATVCCIQK